MLYLLILPATIPSCLNRSNPRQSACGNDNLTLLWIFMQYSATAQPGSECCKWPPNIVLNAHELTMPKSTEEYYRYLAIGAGDRDWGSLCVTGCGYQPGRAGVTSTSPLAAAPIGCTFINGKQVACSKSSPSSTSPWRRSASSNRRPADNLGNLGRRQFVHPLSRVNGTAIVPMQKPDGASIGFTSLANSRTISAIARLIVPEQPILNTGLDEVAVGSFPCGCSTIRHASGPGRTPANRRGQRLGNSRP